MNSELFARVIPQNIENCSANEIHRWCEKCFCGVIKVYFWPGKGQQAFDSNDDVNDNNNDEREFVDNYMAIRVPQK